MKENTKVVEMNEVVEENIIEETVEEEAMEMEVKESFGKKMLANVKKVASSKPAKIIAGATLVAGGAVAAVVLIGKKNNDKALKAVEDGAAKIQEALDVVEDVAV